MNNARVSKKNCDAVLKMIEANVGKPCPTNEDIARDLNISIGIASRAVMALCKQGILERFGSPKRRGFIVVSSGRSTALVKIRIATPAPYDRASERFERAKVLPKHVKYMDIDTDIDSGKLWPKDWPSRPSIRVFG